MLLGVSKLYKGDEGRAQLLTQLRDLRERATRKDQPVLAVRALWTMSQVTARKDPDKSRAYLLEAKPLLQVETTSARILADLADALRESGKADDAKAIYQGILMWHPRAAQKDRAYAGLGLIAAQQGEEVAALDYYSRFEKELLQSTLLPQALKSKADLLAKRGKFEPAIETLEALLKSPAAKGKPSVDALFQIGQAYDSLGKTEKALPYYERIYLMYARFPEYVAKAYWQRGQALEKLKLSTEAQEVYKEFVSRTELNQFENYRSAEQRLKALGGTAS
jgi:tetratricopeptide (TPR) repeat protein